MDASFVYRIKRVIYTYTHTHIHTYTEYCSPVEIIKRCIYVLLRYCLTVKKRNVTGALRDDRERIVRVERKKKKKKTTFFFLAVRSICPMIRMSVEYYSPY